MKTKTMRYSSTGQFTSTQKKLAKEIATRLARLRKTGCYVIAKQDSINAYLEEDIAHSALSKGATPDFIHTVHCLDCGRIDDAGADDEEYFELGYITEE